MSGKRSWTALVQQLRSQLEEEPFDREIAALCFLLLVRVEEECDDPVREIDAVTTRMRDLVRAAMLDRISADAREAAWPEDT